MNVETRLADDDLELLTENGAGFLSRVIFLVDIY